MSKSVKINEAENGYIVMVTDHRAMKGGTKTLIAEDIHKVAEVLVHELCDDPWAFNVQIVKSVDDQLVRVRKEA